MRCGPASGSGWKRFNPGDLLGGAAAAAVALPQSMGLGIVLFAAMGYDASAGAAAGLVGAALLLLISGGVGATRGMISAPNGPMTMLLVGVMGTLAAEGRGGETAIATLAAVLMLTGVFQILFARLGGAQLVKYIPYPVVTGLVSGVGFLMVKSQWLLLAGHWQAGEAVFQNLFPFVIALLTAGVMLATPLLTRGRIPGAVGALFAGIMLYYLLAAVTPVSPADEWVVGVIPSLASMHFGFSLGTFSELPWRIIITSALALTVLGMTACLVTALVADAKTGCRHDSTTEITAQGAAQIVIGLAGGLGGWGTKGATLVAIDAGGRRYVAVAAGLFFLLLMLFGTAAGAYLPVSVLAAIVATVGVRMIDVNIITWLRHRRTRVDALVALLVIAVIVGFNLVAAVGAGVLLSVLLFIALQARTPIVHRRVDARTYRSVVRRTEEENAVLRRDGGRAVMYELKGALFFATADRLRTALGEDLERTDALILHFRRVSYVDMSAMIVLMQLSDEARAKGCELLFCHLHKSIGFGRKAAKAFARIDPKRRFDHRVFSDTDTAFEYAENRLLERAGARRQEAVRSVPAAANDFCRELDAAAVAFITGMGRIRALEPAALLFDRGDRAESLFLVLEGAVEIRLYSGKHAYMRLAKYTPGTYFGEVAFIDPGTRSAAAVVVASAVLLEFDRGELSRLEHGARTDIVTAIFKAIAVRQSRELRRSAEEIRRLEQW